MQTVQRVRCPNCGSLAERWFSGDRSLNSDLIVRTECSVCDYLLVMNMPTGRVIEAYAPGRFGHGSPASSQDYCLARTQ
jgi:hypothetical protein